MPKQPPPPYFVLRGHKGQVSALHFTIELYTETHQPTLISGSDIGEIFIWNLNTNRTEHRLDAHENKTIMFLHCFKSSMLSQGRDGVVNIWTYIEHNWTITNKILSGSVGFCSSLLLPVKDSAQIVLANAEENLLSMHNLSGTQVKNLPYQRDFGMCMCIKAFHSNENMLILAGFENGSIRLFDCETENEMCSLDCHKKPIICMDFDSLHRNAGISGSVDEYLETWSLSEELKLVKIHTIEIKNKGVNAVKIREDGKIVITAGLDFNVRIFSWKTLQPLAVLQFHELPLLSLACCPVSIGEHKAVFASGSKDQNIALWDIY